MTMEANEVQDKNLSLQSLVSNKYIQDGLPKMDDDGDERRLTK